MEITWTNTTTGKNITVEREEDSKRTPPSFLECSSNKFQPGEYFNAVFLRLGVTKDDNINS